MIPKWPQRGSTTAPQSPNFSLPPCEPAHTDDCIHTTQSTLCPFSNSPLPVARHHFILFKEETINQCATPRITQLASGRAGFKPLLLAVFSQHTLLIVSLKSFPQPLILWMKDLGPEKWNQLSQEPKASWIPGWSFLSDLVLLSSCSLNHWGSWKRCTLLPQHSSVCYWRPLKCN